MAIRTPINIVYGNHGTQSNGTDDIMAYLRASLASTNRPVGFSRQPSGNAINVLIEGFGSAAFEELTRDAAKAGAPIIIVNTESIHPKGYWEGTTTPFIESDARFKALMSMAEMATAFWCLAPEQTEQYKAAFGAERVHLYPFGYVDDFEQFFWVEEADRNIDFFFSGGLTDYRGRIMAKLTQAGFSCLALKGDTKHLIRADLAAHAKACLALRQNETWPLPSVARLHFHLMGKSLVIAEQCDSPSAFDAYVELAAPDDLIEVCAETIMAGGTAKRGLENFERFRNETGVKGKVEEVLDLSLR